MARETPATRALAALGVAFELRVYDYDPGADRIGMQAAEALGEPPARVLKTLMVEIDGNPACAIVASDREIGMKALAQAAAGKSAKMMPPAAAERMTGYKVGGISPLGQRRMVPTILDAVALAEPYVYVNGGQRGLQIRIAPAVLATALTATISPIAA